MAKIYYVGDWAVMTWSGYKRFWLRCLDLVLKKR